MSRVDTSSFRARLSGLALEAFMVVFAVLVALGVEEWREEHEMQQFADRVQAAVMAEIDANLAELRSTTEGLRETTQRLGDAISANDVSALPGSISVELPDFSSAAWSAAQASQAAPYLDYAWLIEVGRAYETYELYSRLSDQVVDAMSDLVGSDGEVSGMRVMLGRLRVLMSVHDQVIERLESLVEPDSEEEM